MKEGYLRHPSVMIDLYLDRTDVELRDYRLRTV
jgi:hypothetical protein